MTCPKYLMRSCIIMLNLFYYEDEFFQWWCCDNVPSKTRKNPKFTLNFYFSFLISLSYQNCKTLTCAYEHCLRPNTNVSDVVPTTALHAHSMMHNTVSWWAVEYFPLSLFVDCSFQYYRETGHRLACFFTTIGSVEHNSCGKPTRPGITTVRRCEMGHAYHCLGTLYVDMTRFKPKMKEEMLLSLLY